MTTTELPSTLVLLDFDGVVSPIKANKDEFNDATGFIAFRLGGFTCHIHKKVIEFLNTLNDAGNPEILFEAPHPVDNAFSGFDASDGTPFGTVVLLDSPEYGENSIVVYAPGCIDENDCVEEGGWTNAYGAIFTHEEINAYGLFVLVYARNKIKRLG